MSLFSRFVVLAGAACVAACSSVTRTPPAEAPKAVAQASTPAPTPPVESQPQPSAHEEKAAPPASKPAQAPPAAKPKAPPPRKPAPPSRAPAAEPPKPAPVAQAPAPVAQAPAPKPAPLDLKSLEQRLKDTSAIGVLTKLSLKNQVDDLVGQFRAYHDGKRPPTLAELRPGFDLLLMKVLSLLQDKDPGLAHDVNASRDAIWSVLADKQKFAEFS